MKYKITPFIFVIYGHEPENCDKLLWLLGHHRNQYWLNVYCVLRERLQWHLNQHTMHKYISLENMHLGISSAKQRPYWFCADLIATKNSCEMHYSDIRLASMCLKSPATAENVSMSWHKRIWSVYYVSTVAITFKRVHLCQFHSYVITYSGIYLVRVSKWND